MNPGLSRRECLLLGAALGPFAAPVAGQTNITPAEEFFVRDHFESPGLSMSGWKLRVEGRVTRPLELTFSDLLEAPSTKLESVLECAGNGAAGNGVSSGVWQGASLAQLLKDAGADPSGSILLEGADEGQLLKGRPRTPYLRLVPQNKCRTPESLIAYKLNDRFLPRANGFPARVVFPGWYGMDSVKWLRRIAVLGPAETPPGYDESGMRQLYSRLRRDAPPQRITRILVKSMIAYPQNGAKLPAGTCLVKGFAWTGQGLVKHVEVSADGGKSWSAADLEPRPQPFTWIRWRYAWQARPGEQVLLSRARDSAGESQPLERDPGRLDSYELNWCAPLRCIVR